MAAEPVIFGLSPAIVADMQAVFARYPAIERVVIFGSRAKGTLKDASDIDLAVFAPKMSDSEFSQLWAEIDSLPLIFKVDCVHWDKLANEDLKNKITQNGTAILQPVSSPFDVFRSSPNSTGPYTPGKQIPNWWPPIVPGDWVTLTKGEITVDVRVESITPHLAGVVEQPRPGDNIDRGLATWKPGQMVNFNYNNIRHVRKNA
ncbi:MAG: nucleotidyltransferase domain-containing protein [Nevskiales bacterium]